jgi:hypothetical protein
MLASILHQIDRQEEALNEANDLTPRLYALVKEVRQQNAMYCTIRTSWHSSCHLVSSKGIRVR